MTVPRPVLRAGRAEQAADVELLRTSSLAVGEIAETLDTRQPQTSKHLEVRAESGIVRVGPRARQRIYHLRAEPFDRIARWVEEATATICHTNDLTLTGDGENTVVNLHVVITEIGPKAKLAAFGMKWGYKAQLDALEKHLAG